MSRDIVVPAFWADFYEQTHIPAAVRSGSTVRLTGHTGEDEHGSFPPTAVEQLRGTFRNIGMTLAEAGASWADVVEIHSFHVGYREQAESSVEIAAEFLSDPYPVWTAVGVSELFDAEALVEISCVAELRG